MPRYNVQKLDRKEKADLIDLFYESVRSLRAKQEIISFFKDLLTDSESVMLARRVLIAKMILNGKMFHEIREELGASNDTINTVKRFLDYGQDGYQRVIDRIEK